MKNLVILGLILTLVMLPATVLVGCQQQPAPSPTPAPSPEPTPPPLEPVPAPSPPPTPAPKVLFSDDFSDETNGWDTFDDETGSAYYHGGVFHLKNDIFAELDVVSYYRHQEFTDFILEVETRLVDGTDDNCHTIGCRGQPTEWANDYSFIISADGYYGIAKLVDGEPIELCPMTKSIHIHKGQDAVNVMRVECIGSSLRLSVNGHLLVEVVDDSYASGLLSFAATAWTEKYGKTITEIAFDNLVVTSP